MLVRALQRIVSGAHLTRDEAQTVLQQILTGHATEAQIGGLLVALAIKGETVEELVGFASAMRAEATAITIPNATLAVAQVAPVGLPDAAGSVVDTCGTGGDASGTFNISTATAFTVAGAGQRVAKHGNRSISSRCGSADVMEALGVNLALSPTQLGACLEEVGIAFLYAPALHPAMRYVQAARRALGVRTIFNLLGPLTNPAGAEAQVVGVYAPHLTTTLAQVLLQLGTQRAFVVHGEDGLDEISNTAPTHVAEIVDNEVRNYVLDATELGFKRANLADLAGGDVETNAAIVREVLSGTRGPRRDVVVLNAAAALVAGRRARNLHLAIPMAQAALDSGAARRKLEQLVAFTQRAAASAATREG